MLVCIKIKIVRTAVTHGHTCNGSSCCRQMRRTGGHPCRIESATDCHAGGCLDTSGCSSSWLVHFHQPAQAICYAASLAMRFVTYCDCVPRIIHVNLIVIGFDHVGCASKRVIHILSS